MLSRIRKFMKSEAGFTLTELVTVMVVVGVLATVAVVKYERTAAAGKDAVITETADKVRLALQSYYAQTRSYPATAAFNAAILSGSPYFDLPSGEITLHYANGILTIKKGIAPKIRAGDFTYASSGADSFALTLSGTYDVSSH